MDNSKSISLEVLILYVYLLLITLLPCAKFRGHTVRGTRVIVYERKHH